jgi:predicted TIM-barrel fold metal-dependent hydrolase
MWNLSWDYLVGRNVYMDTSSSLAFMEPERAVEMIRKHGADKMLFGSDYPMWDHREELDRFNALKLTENERKAILYGNAHRLLSV